MITNPGFSFSGISGTHKIVPVNETDLPLGVKTIASALSAHMTANW